MSERELRQRVVKLLRPLDAMAVENPCKPGTPDIEYVGGWLECKCTKKWPAHRDTIVRLDHPLLPTQRVWIRSRTRRGGNVFVLVQINKTFLLFDGAWAAHRLGYVPARDLLAASLFTANCWAMMEEHLLEYLRVYSEASTR